MHKGFTLVEILIALAILAMIVVSTLTIFRSASKSWQKGEVRSERYHNARSAIGRMSAEISQAVMDNSLSTFSGGKNKIQFITFVSSTSGVFELSEIEYWYDEPKKVLMRNDDTEPDYDFLTYDHRDILATDISELEFSYYDGSTWSENWNSDTNLGIGLPKAVKIHVKAEDRKGKEGEVFEVIARLKTA